MTPGDVSRAKALVVSESTTPATDGSRVHHGEDGRRKVRGTPRCDQEIEAVSTAHIVAGNYDIIAEVDADEIYDVLQAVSSGIQGLEGVTDTKTYIEMG